MKNKLYEEMLCLIDGAYDIIEIFKTKSPAQKEWKKNWLVRARKVGASGE